MDMPAVSAAAISAVIVSEADLVAHIQVVSPDTAWLSTAAGGVAAWRLGTQRVGIGSWPSIGLRSGQTVYLWRSLRLLLSLLSLQLRLLQVPLLLGGKAEETAVSRDRGLPFYYRETMKCGTGTPPYSAISDPTSTHKKTPKATLAYQGSYCLDFLALGLGIFFSRPKRPGDLP